MHRIRTISLKHNFHKETGNQYIRSCFRTGLFSDLTLFCEHKEIKAHKIIVCSYSLYLKKLIEENASEHAVIVLTELSYETLMYIIKFMYEGQLPTSIVKLYDVLKAARVLEMKVLIDYLSRVYVSSVDLFGNQQKKSETMELFCDRKREFQSDMQECVYDGGIPTRLKVMRKYLKHAQDSCEGTQEFKIEIQDSHKHMQNHFEDGLTCWSDNQESEFYASIPRSLPLERDSYQDIQESPKDLKESPKYFQESLKDLQKSLKDVQESQIDVKECWSDIQEHENAVNVSKHFEAMQKYLKNAEDFWEDTQFLFKGTKEFQNNIQESEKDMEGCCEGAQECLSDIQEHSYDSCEGTPEFFEKQKKAFRHFLDQQESFEESMDGF